MAAPLVIGIFEEVSSLPLNFTIFTIKHLYSHWKDLTLPVQITHPSLVRSEFSTLQAQITDKCSWGAWGGEEGDVEASN